MQQHKENCSANPRDNDDQASTSSSSTRSIESLQRVSICASKKGSHKPSPSSTSSLPECSQVTKSKSRPGRASSMPECIQATFTGKEVKFYAYITSYTLSIIILYSY